MKNYLWKISDKNLEKTNIFLYSKYIEKTYKINFSNNFDKLWKWSIKNPKDFWKSIWYFTKVEGNLGKKILEKSNLKILSASDLNDAAKTIVEAIK